MAKGVVTFVEQMFWTIIWVFIAIILGYFILGYLKNNMSGNILGSFADWVDSHTQPQ